MLTSSAARMVQSKAAFWAVWAIASLSSVLLRQLDVAHSWHTTWQLETAYPVVRNGPDGPTWSMSSELEPSLLREREPFRLVPRGRVSVDLRVPRAGWPDSSRIAVHATLSGPDEVVEVRGAHRVEALWSSRYVVTREGVRLRSVSLVSDFERLGLLVIVWFVVMALGWATVCWMRWRLQRQHDSST